MNLTKGIVFGVALICSSGLYQPAQAQVTKKGSAYVLRYKWVKGKSYTYALSASTMQQGSQRPIAETFGMTLSVLDAKAGVGTVKYALSGNTRVSDQPQVVNVSATGKPAKPGTNADELIRLPEKATAIGGKWSYSNTSNQIYGRATVNYTMTLKKVGAVNGKQVAVIDVVTKVSGNNLSGSGSGQLTLDVADGMIINMSQSMNLQTKMTNSSGKTNTISLPIKITISRR